jgi:hypothetical protein
MGESAGVEDIIADANHPAASCNGAGDGPGLTAVVRPLPVELSSLGVVGQISGDDVGRRETLHVDLVG